MNLAQGLAAGVAAGAVLAPPALLAAQYEKGTVNPRQVADACWDIANGDPSVADIAGGPVSITLSDGRTAEISLPSWCAGAVLNTLEGHANAAISVGQDPETGKGHVTYSELPSLERLSQAAQVAEDTVEDDRDNAVGARTLVVWSAEAAVVGLALAGKKMF